jgi:hypothetical protein
VRCGELIPAKRVATVHKILSSRIYSGDFDWKGKTYKGTYEPLVTRELWQWVQDALAGHRGTRIRKAKHDFPFSGLISCGHCGCALVGDIKKGKYVYYRCSGFKGKEGRDLILDAPHPRQFPLRPYTMQRIRNRYRHVQTVTRRLPARRGGATIPVSILLYARSIPLSDIAAY